MPWIKDEDCVGCGICIQVCPVGAINMKDKVAVMDEELCIRCGKCHDVCPQSAIRHDFERIPKEVDNNIKWVKTLLENYETEEERKALIQRIVKHFNKLKVIAEKTIEKVKTMEVK